MGVLDKIGDTINSLTKKNDHDDATNDPTTAANTSSNQHAGNIDSKSSLTSDTKSTTQRSDTPLAGGVTGSTLPADTTSTTAGSTTADTAHHTNETSDPGHGLITQTLPSHSTTTPAAVHTTTGEVAAGSGVGRVGETVGRHEEHHLGHQHHHDTTQTTGSSDGLGQWTSSTTPSTATRTDHHEHSLRGAYNDATRTDHHEHSLRGAYDDASRTNPQDHSVRGMQSDASRTDSRDQTLLGAHNDASGPKSHPTISDDPARQTASTTNPLSGTTTRTDATSNSTTGNRPTSIPAEHHEHHDQKHGATGFVPNAENPSAIPTAGGKPIGSGAPDDMISTTDSTGRATGLGTDHQQLGHNSDLSDNTRTTTGSATTTTGSSGVIH